MQYAFLYDLVLVFGVSALSVLILHRLKIHALVGFIAAGMLIGPGGLGLIKDTHSIEVLAEIGVILLLFTIGIETSIKRLLKLKKTLVVGGGLQVTLTIAFAALITYQITDDVVTSVFLGFLAALSSTAVVLKVMFERGETDTPHGRSMLGVLIFQDLCVVPMMLLVPIMAGGTANISELGLAATKAVFIVAVVLMSAKWLVPKLLHQVVRTRSRELFTITLIFICLGTALLTSQMGLSLALGAFMAGIVISESEFTYEATAEILPFKDSFMGLFFVSTGMLLDTGFLLDNIPEVLTVVVVILLLKSLIAAAALLAASVSLKISLHAGIALSQTGEFSFVLAEVGRGAGIFSGTLFQLFLSASVITMALTPLLLRVAPVLAERIASVGILKRFSRGFAEEASPGLYKHVIIMGFGHNGRSLARTLRGSGVSYVALDLNSDTVREEKRKGQPIYYGDGTSRDILKRLGIQSARLMVIGISDPAAARKIVAAARKENPDIHIIVRTRYLAEVEELRGIGADEVIPEEFETSVEIFAKVLAHYSVPRNVIMDHIEDIRKDGYEMLRSREYPAKRITERHDIMSAIETEAYLIKVNSRLAERSLSDVALRSNTGATVITLQRGKEIFQNPSPFLAMQEGDIVLLMGTKEQINKAMEYLEANEDD